jgi:hypothetical protein
MAFYFNQGDRPLPGYTIQRGIGTGGFGEVYYATSDGGKEVALKYLRDNPQVELRGATHCLNLKSPYLVALHDIKQSPDGAFFVIMEYVNGPTLRDLMSSEPAGLGPQKAAYFLREIGKGLAYLHDRGIVHRDLKPGNIFYEDGYVKIGDYGLSKIMAASQHSGQTMSVGTVHYMAPEVGSGNYDRTIDVYALGVVLYEMLLGRVPFSGASMGEVLMKHLTAQPEVDELPEPFPRVIRKALAKDPNDRYQTVTEMMAEVFEVEDLSRSVAAFEPASLSTLAARAARDVNVTLAAPGGGPAVAVVGAGSSNVGQGMPPPVIDPGAEHRGGGGRFDRMAVRAGSRVDRVTGRLDRTRFGQGVAAVGHRPRSVLESIALAIIVCAGISTAVMVIDHQGPQYAVALLTHSAAIVGGVLLSLRLTRNSNLAFDRHAARSDALAACESRKWPTRLIGMAVVAGTFAAVNAVSRHSGLLGSGSLHWAAPVIVAVLLCDWRGRLVAGRKGEFSIGSAFSAGLLGYVLAAIWADGSGLPIAGMLAASSLGIQALGGIWPLGDGSGDSEAAEGRDDVAAPRAATGTDEKNPAWRRMWDTMTRTQEEARRVAVSRGGQVNAAGTMGARATVPEAGATVPMPVREARSSAVRVCWAFAAAFLLFAMIFAFVSPAVMNWQGNQFAAPTVAGVVLAQAVVFCLTCIFPAYKKGIWRGVFRQAIFFTGTAMAGGCGAAIGLFHLQNEAFLAALAGILLGAVASLLVWFVPVPAYVPKAPPPKDDETQAQHRKAHRLKFAGKCCLVSAPVLIPILLAAVHPTDHDEVLPAVLGPLVLLGLCLLISGFVVARPRPRKPKPIELPLRRGFEIDSLDDLDSLLERHMSMYGYSLRNRGELLWQFARGDWLAQFWQSDIRRWKTDLTIAAYRRPEDGYRVNCHLDVDAGFSNPKQAQLRRLEMELDDLQGLLGGRALTDSGQAGLV